VARLRLSKLNSPAEVATQTHAMMLGLTKSDLQ
jgi:hypothetical protein